MRRQLIARHRFPCAEEQCVINCLHRTRTILARALTHHIWHTLDSGRARAQVKVYQQPPISCIPWSQGTPGRTHIHKQRGHFTNLISNLQKGNRNTAAIGFQNMVPLIQCFGTSAELCAYSFRDRSCNLGLDQRAPEIKEVTLI